MVAETGQSSAVASKHNTSVNGGENAPPKGHRSVKIILLDGSEFNVDVDKSAKGSEVFEKITQRLNLWEKDYFGLSYRDSENHRIWLNHEKKISKQMHDKPWAFWFETKFYPPEPSQLQEDITRYYLCLQIQNDVVSGKLPCSFVTYALLGSYLVQAQVGDYDLLERQHGTSEEEYLLDFRFAPFNSAELLQKVCELHKAHRGMTPEDAETRYLEIAKTLAMYGVDLHTAKDSENAEVSLGVCSSGLLVYRDRLRVNRFAWPKILKISFRRTHFYIKIRPGEFEQRDTTVGFRLANYKSAERLWKSCVEHHTFFRLMSPEPPPKKSLLRMGSSRFRFNGRTHYQTRLASALIERQQPNFLRSQSARFPTRTTIDGFSAKEHVKPAHTSESASPLHYHSAGSPREYASIDKNRPHSVGERFPLPVYSLQRDKELVEYTLPANVLTPPQKEYYIIAPQKSPSVDAEKSHRSTDENALRRPVSPPEKSQGVISRIGSGLDNSQSSPRSKIVIPVFEQVHPSKSGLIERQPPPSLGIESPGDANKRLSGPNDRAVMEEIERVIEQGPTNVEKIVEADGTVRMTTSSSQVRTVKRTVQRETVETFMAPASAINNMDAEYKIHTEHGIDVYSDGDIDHDAELTAAIMEATKMNPSYTVEKIEVKRHSQY